MGMKSNIFASLALIGAAMPAFCQSAPTDKVALTVTRAELNVIGQGVMELPYKVAAPIMATLQAQLNAADQAAAKAAVDAAKPKDPAKVDEKPATSDEKAADAPAK
jgi:hypothetical protein